MNSQPAMQENQAAAKTGPSGKADRLPSKGGQTRAAGTGPDAQPVPRTAETAGSNTATLASDQLKGYMAEIGRLEAEKKQISDDIGEIYKAAKDKGFDTSIMRDILKRQKMSPEERAEREAQIGLYEGVLGLTSEQEAEQLGVEAASKGLPLTANPYTRKSPKHLRWENAWQMQTALMACDDKSFGERSPKPAASPDRTGPAPSDRQDAEPATSAA